jgi:hypothetical protein
MQGAPLTGSCLIDGYIDGYIMYWKRNRKALEEYIRRRYNYVS